MNRPVRRGTSLVEALIFAGLGLLIAALAIGLLANTWRHDARTERRLDGASTLATVLANLREDLWLALDVTAAADGFELKQAGDRAVTYRWPRSGERIRRDGHPLGVRAASAFALLTGAGMLSIELPAPRPVRVQVRIAPDARRLRDRYAMWGPPTSARAAP